MSSQSGGLQHVPSRDQFREMLRYAARIKDKSLSVEIFFLLVIGGRLGLRIGEILHFDPEWVDLDERKIMIPEKQQCNCQLCQEYAAKKANNSDMTIEEALEEYWQPKSLPAGARTIPIKTDRELEIIELYLDLFRGDKLTYSTARRRVLRFTELFEGTDANNWCPHLLRATAVTHWAWAGMRQPALESLFGWGDREYGTAYVRRTGILVAREMNRILGITSEDEYALRPDPPTWSDLRPDDVEDMVEVEELTPDVDSPDGNHRFESAEERFLEGDASKTTLDQFLAVGPFSAVTSIFQNPDPTFEPIETPQEFSMVLAGIGLAAVALAIVATWGNSPEPLALGVAAGVITAFD